MKFEKRDIILIAGVFLVVLGITQYVPFHYSSIIGILLFFGIKFFVHRRKQIIENDIGEGVCMDCGFKIINKKCPNCDGKMS